MLGTWDPSIIIKWIILAGHEYAACCITEGYLLCFSSGCSGRTKCGLPSLPGRSCPIRPHTKRTMSLHTCFLKACLLVFPVLSLMGHRVLVLKEPSERSIFEDSRRKAGTPAPTSVERQSCIPGLGKQ